MPTTSRTIVNQMDIFFPNPPGTSQSESSQDVSPDVGLASLVTGETNRFGNHGTSESVARVYAPIDTTLTVSIPPGINIHSVNQLMTRLSPKPEKHGTESREFQSSDLPEVESSQNAKSVLDVWEYMNITPNVAASIREGTRDIREKFTEGDLTGLEGDLLLKDAAELAPLQLGKEGTSPLALLQQCQDSLVNKAFDIVDTAIETRLPAPQQEALPSHTQHQTSAVSGSLVPEPGNITGGPDMVHAHNYHSDITNREIENEENALDDRVSALREVGSSLVQAGISSATGRMLDTPAGAVLQVASGMFSTATTLHTLEGEDTKSDVLNLVQSRSQNANLGSIPFNIISEATLEHTGLGKVMATASEVIAVADAVKSGDASTILEDEHVQELGKKVLDVGLEFAASAILTASGAGTAMAVASAASEVIAATKEAKNIENGKYGLTGFILETGAKIALEAAIKGSGAGAVLDIAAPILEPLCQEVIDQATEHGAEFIDQAARSTGVDDILKNGLDAVIQVEERVTTRVLKIEEQGVEGTILTSFQAEEGMVQLVAGVKPCVPEATRESDQKIVTPIFPVLDEATQEVPQADKAMKQADLPPPFTDVHFESMDKIINITSSNFLGCTTITAVSSAMDVINGKLTGSFEPTRAGLDLLAFLCHINEGSSTVNGLSITAIAKTYELAKSEVTNVAGRHRTLFDPDGDGIVHYGDTVQALTFLGLQGFMVRLAAYNFHVMFSYPTGDEWLPRFKTSLPIHLKNMNRIIQGRDWGTLDRAKLVNERLIHEFFSGSLCLGPQTFQILLFLLEWGTMWPFHVPSVSTDETLKPEEIGPVFTSAIIPMILKHWELFRKSKR